MPHTIANGVKLYYEIHGNAGTPLLLIAGLGSSIIDWELAFIADASEAHRVVLFDNRATGQSELVAPPFTMAQFAADSVCLLDALGIQQAHVLGYSMGGMIAQHVALDYPERLLSLSMVATGPAGPQTPGVFPPSQEVLAQLASPQTDDRAQDMRDGWWIGYTQTYIETHRAELEKRIVRKLSYPETEEATIQGQIVATTLTHDTRSRLAEIRCPTLIQTGTEDILIPPENSRLIADRIPHAQFRQYPNCAHGLYEESEGTAIHDLLAFLQQVDSTQQDGGRV